GHLQARRTPGMTWYAALVVVLALCGAGAAIALLQPVVLLCLRHTDAARRIAARRHAMFSAVIVAGAIAWAIKLSFAGHAPNLVAGVAMLVCAGLLVLFAFGMRPNFVGVSVGL